MANETVEISRDDAKIIKDMMEEFFLAGDLSADETRAFLNLCGAGDFGRPVPNHGSGPSNPAF